MLGFARVEGFRTRDEAGQNKRCGDDLAIHGSSSRLSCLGSQNPQQQFQQGQAGAAAGQRLAQQQMQYLLALIKLR
jgi:hypothetical protein